MSTLPPVARIVIWPPDRRDGWPPGGELFHCHRRAFDAVQFNPRSLPRSRFSPILDGLGNSVPAWYGASTPEGAVAESLFHDIPVAAGGRLTAAALQGQMVSAVQPIRPLRLVRLDTEGLRALGLHPADVTDNDADRYRDTEALAQRLHDTTDADGLAWMSRRHNISAAIVLYEDRVSTTDFTHARRHLDFDALDGWEWLRAYGAGQRIVVDPPVGY